MTEERKERTHLRLVSSTTQGRKDTVLSFFKCFVTGSRESGEPTKGQSLSSMMLIFIYRIGIASLSIIPRLLSGTERLQCLDVLKGSIANFQTENKLKSKTCSAVKLHTNTTKDGGR